MLVARWVLVDVSNFFFSSRRRHTRCSRDWSSDVCSSDLEGGWLTLVLTAGLIGLCFAIRRHYRSVQANLQRLDAILPALPTHEPGTAPSLDPKARTAVLLVGSYEGLGAHCLLSIQRLFPNVFENFVFASVGVIDSATFKNVEEVEEVRAQTQAVLARYVATARALRLAADWRMTVGTEIGRAHV